MSMFVCLKGHILAKSLKQHKMLIRNTEVYSTIEDKIVSSVRGFIIKQRKSILLGALLVLVFHIQYHASEKMPLFIISCKPH